MTFGDRVAPLQQSLRDDLVRGGRLASIWIDREATTRIEMRFGLEQGQSPHECEGHRLDALLRVIRDPDAHETPLSGDPCHAMKGCRELQFATAANDSDILRS